MATCSDSTMLETMVRRMAEARAFRAIAVLILKGVADGDPERFVAECKRLAQQAAQEGA